VNAVIICSDNFFFLAKKLGCGYVIFTKHQMSNENQQNFSNYDFYWIRFVH